MYAGGRDAFGSRWHELRVVDQLLSQLARPSIVGDELPPSTEEKLRALGFELGGEYSREELIMQLWSRKRPLMRQLSTFDDPIPPCA